MTQVLDLLLLHVTVQQKGCVLLLSQLFLMDLLQVLNQKINLRDVQKFTNDIGGLHKTQS
jgi:hypothetical protein